MSYKKEVILHFPLRKENKGSSKKVKSLNTDSNTNEKLNRFYRLTEELCNDEWHQEYFLIYNSYTLDNP